MALTLKQELRLPLMPGKKITIGQAIINCNRLGRSYRRRLCRTLSLRWLEFCELEKYCLSGI